MSIDDATREGDGDVRGFIARIQAGDEEAARELLNRFESKVRLVVRRQLPKLLRSRFDSLDLTQSIWGDFFNRVRTGPVDFQDSQHLIAFLAWTAKKKVIDEYRHAASQKQDMRREESLWSVDDRPRDLAADTETPSEVAQAHEAFDRLRDLLPESRHNVLALKAEGFSSREIGERLGMSERTIQRVIEDLRRRAQIEG